MTKKKQKYKQWSTKHCTKNKTIELHEPHLKLGVYMFLIWIWYTKARYQAKFSNNTKFYYFNFIFFKYIFWLPIWYLQAFLTICVSCSGRLLIVFSVINMVLHKIFMKCRWGVFSPAVTMCAIQFLKVSNVSA
jgi:hypothetical protein